jgi:hypothetical protein
MGSPATLPRLDFLPALRTRLGLATFILTAACNHESPTQPLSRVPPGKWGGSEIAMTVTQSGATLQQTCANGTLDQPLLLDASSRFDETGKYTRQVGGPVLPDAHPARYTGSTDGSTMTLMVMETDDGLTFGPFTLTFGLGTTVSPCPLL